MVIINSNHILLLLLLLLSSIKQSSSKPYQSKTLISHLSSFPITKIRPSSQHLKPTLLRKSPQKRLPTIFQSSLSGGLAGMTGTVLLYPLDTAKTLRQSNPRTYPSVTSALSSLLFSSKLPSDLNIPNKVLHIVGNKELGWRRAYVGVTSSALGSIPSSALYFGGYETVKRFLTKRALVYERSNSSERDNKNTDKDSGTYAIKDGRLRFLVHAISAASGNALSSLIFVPKEYIKQRIQIQSSSAYVHTASASASASQSRSKVVDIIVSTMETKGVKGFYSGYKATLARNIPSAVLRFGIYEELRNFVMKDNGDKAKTKTSRINDSTKLFLIAALSGSISSFITTPLDVLKTRLATAPLPPHLKTISTQLMYIYKEDGIRGLWAGGGSRVIWSGVFSSVGLGTWEVLRGWIGGKG